MFDPGTEMIPERYAEEDGEHDCVQEAELHSTP